MEGFEFFPNFEKTAPMKENIKIFLLGIIAIATVIIVFELASVNEHQQNLAEQPQQAAPNQAVVTNPMAANPQLPEGVDYVDQKIVPPPTDMKKTTIRWSDMIHDFGHVKQDSENKFSFTFVNSGKEPLVITNAVGSCGCTVPDYPKDPVAPGATASINVVYKPGKQENQQEKMVTVTANTEPMQTVLKIRAFVEK